MDIQHPPTAASDHPAKQQLAFISHASEDHTVAQLVCSTLEERGVPCWVAPRDIQPGEDYPDAILRGIAASSTMVLVFSSNASQSKFVKREVILGVEHNLVIIPFRIEDVRPEKDMEFNLAGVHWLDALVPPLDRHLSVLAERVAVILKLPIAGSQEASRTRKPQSSPQNKGLQIAIGVVVALLVIAASFFVLRPHRVADSTLRAQLERKLESTLAPLGVRIGCDACSQQEVHVNVRVEEGNATLSGILSPAQLQVLRATPLQSEGIASISYSIGPMHEASQSSASQGAPPVKAVAATSAAATSRPATMKAAAPQVPGDDELRVKQLIANGRKQLASGNYVSAANNFEAALDIDPDNAAAKAGLAEIEQNRR